MLYRYSGIAGIIVLWVSVSLSLYITRLNVLGYQPVSYLGVLESSKYLFNTGLILASLLLLVFLRYLNTKLTLTKVFITSFVIGQICQIIVALTPYNSSTVLRPIHITAGFALAVTLPLSIWLFSKTPGLDSALRKLSVKYFYIELILFTVGISWFIFASRAGALSEILTAVAYDLWIIALSIKLGKTFGRDYPTE